LKKISHGNESVFLEVIVIRYWSKKLYYD